jgi:hypothetical protein
MIAALRHSVCRRNQWKPDMHRKVAEQIITAMKGLDRAFGQLDISLREIEEEDERRRMLRVLIGVYADAYNYITLPREPVSRS